MSGGSDPEAECSFANSATATTANSKTIESARLLGVRERLDLLLKFTLLFA
jgi:hypothetical protein